MNEHRHVRLSSDSRLPAKIRRAIEAEVERVNAHFGHDDSRHVLIIGGAGYVGGPVTSHLLRSGIRVRVLDQLIYGHGAAVSGFLLHPDYSFIRGDMGDPAAMNTALDGITDVVILAGLVGDPITKSFPEESHRINDIALWQCIDQLNGRGLNKVIFISTCSNYGLIGDGEIADEGFELNPLSLYAKSKVAAEQYLLSLAGQIDYHPTILRFATAFGLAPRMRFDLTINEFTRELAAANELAVYDAHTWRPYCHVRDFARLIERVLAFPVETLSFEVFNAGGDENNHTKQSIVDLILERIPDARVSYKANSSDPRNYRVSFEKARKRLFFEPSWSVVDGIDEILWAFSNGFFDDVEARRDFYANAALPGLRGPDQVPARILEPA